LLLDGQLVKKSAKTRQIKARTSPVFDETFEFIDYCLGSENNPDCGIFFYVCQLNSFGRDQLLGKYVQNLDPEQLINSESAQLRKMFKRDVDILDPIKAYKNCELGSLQVKLEFKQDINLVTVNVIAASNLKMPKIYMNNEKTPSKN